MSEVVGSRGAALTTVILAPSGAGKNTRIGELQKKADLHHINRDAIRGDILHSYGTSHSDLSSGNLTAEQIRRMGMLAFDRDVEFTGRVHKECLKGTPHIVIDFPPGGSMDWLDQTFAISRAFGRRIIVEGISVDPIVSLPRVLERDSAGIDLAHEKLAMLDPESPRFKDWLETYKKMPSAFLSAVASADQACLLDANRTDEKPRLIAEWSHGIETVLDAHAFLKFKALDEIDRARATFTAEPVGPPDPHTGKQAFKVATHRFYNAEGGERSGRSSAAKDRPVF